ncbi:patatin [Sagittula sp. P11]|uniref:patatin-like phospholipase family protein n=1 Tax=Sagittula sp. P11 TaxID=2009329 RepID=UPI000C2D33FB|nr:patatin-like phospholipase family protein [Sagittula sp. P11]AUC51772.1 patatin [Sagittula sp. P11]
MTVLGLALGAGGARGWCHIGVLRALEDMGVEPQVVAGCSMGAVVGAAWAGGKLDALEDWARGLTQGKFLKFLDFRLDRGGVIEGKAVTRLMEELELPENIEDLPRPFLAVATDMSTGREIWLRKGNLAQAVRASASIPGVFSPTEVDGRWLLDGGLINPVPASAVRALGATCTIAVHPDARHGKMWEPKPVTGLWDKLGAQLPETIGGLLPQTRKEPVPGYAEVVTISIEIMMEFMRKAREASDPPDVLLQADLLNAMGLLELYRADVAIDEGRRIAEEARDRIMEVAGVTPEATPAFTKPESAKDGSETSSLPPSIAPEEEPGGGSGNDTPEPVYERVRTSLS